MYCYTNPPEEELPDELLAITVPASVQSDSLVLASASLDALFGGSPETDDFRTVIIVPEHDVPGMLVSMIWQFLRVFSSRCSFSPEATSVTLACQPALPDISTEDLLSGWLDAYYGVGSSVARHGAVIAALRPPESDEEDTEPVSDWMKDYLTAGQCSYKLAWVGQQLSVDGSIGETSTRTAGFRVTATVPRGPVIVGPSTTLLIAPSTPHE